MRNRRTGILACFGEAARQIVRENRRKQAEERHERQQVARKFDREAADHQENRPDPRERQQQRVRKRRLGGRFTLKQGVGEPRRRAETDGKRGNQREQAERNAHAVPDRLLDLIPIFRRPLVLNHVGRLRFAQHHVVLLFDLPRKFLKIQRGIRLAGDKNRPGNQRGGNASGGEPPPFFEFRAKAQRREGGFAWRLGGLARGKQGEEMRQRQHAEERRSADLRGEREAGCRAAQRGKTEFVGRLDEPRRAIDREQDEKGQHHVNRQKVGKLNMQDGQAQKGQTQQADALRKEAPAETIEQQQRQRAEERGHHPPGQKEIHARRPFAEPLRGGFGGKMDDFQQINRQRAIREKFRIPVVRLKVVHGVQQPRFVGMKEIRQRPIHAVKAQADAENQQQKKQKRAFHNFQFNCFP